MISFQIPRFATRCTLLLWLVQSTFIVSNFVARAQAPQSTLAAPSLPALEVSPGVLNRDGIVTLRLPPGVAPRAQMRIGIFERGRPARLAEVRREWTNLNGQWQTQLRIEADPGRYELRILNDDKTRTPLSLPATLVAPGIDREPGWWLFNGLPFVETDLEMSVIPDQSTLMPAAPLFVPGLKRDLNRKAKSSSANLSLSGGPTWRWKIIELPGLEAMLTAGYDWNGLRSRIELKLREVRERGEHHLIGFSTNMSFAAQRTNNTMASTPLPDTRNVVLRLRQMLNAIAPDAALTLRVTGDATAANAILAASPALFDAIWIQDLNSLWPLKVARRIVEEQPAYDLPLWTQVADRRGTGSDRISAGRSREAGQLDLFLSGATGFIGERPEWASLIERNLPLFVGSVTLEDVGLLPVASDEDSQTIQLYETLRSIGRIPLLARTDLPKDERRAESLMVRLGRSIDQSTLDALRRVADAGARVYIEGTPLEADGPTSAFSKLVNATITPTAARPTTMTMDDVWTFGTARGAVVPIEQSVSVALKPVVAGTRKKKEARGIDELTSPRVLAKLADGSPALIQIPIGDGQILWLPNPVSKPLADTRAAETGAPIDQFYAAIAGLIQPALVQVREVSATANVNTNGITRGVRVALRASSKGTLLLGVFNESKRQRSVSIEVQSGAEAALELATEDDVAVQRRGFSSTLETTLPLGGWKLFALGASRQAIDDERNSPRLKARLR